jgi:hypothetical protein
MRHRSCRPGVGVRPRTPVAGWARMDRREPRGDGSALCPPLSVHLHVIRKRWIQTAGLRCGTSGATCFPSAQRTAVQLRSHQQMKRCQVATSQAVVVHHGLKVGRSRSRRGAADCCNGLLGGAPWPAPRRAPACFRTADLTLFIGFVGLAVAVPRGASPRLRARRSWFGQRRPIREGTSRGAPCTAEEPVAVARRFRRAVEGLHHGERKRRANSR